MTEETGIHLAPIVKDTSGYERLKVEPHPKNENNSEFHVMKEDDNVTIKNDESSQKSDLAFYDTSGVVDTTRYEALVILDQWLAKVCAYFEFYEIPLVDRLNRVTSMLEGSALAWFNWRMRGGLIDGWEDFVKKFQIRFAPLHDLDYVCFEKTSEKSRDTFAHMVENANTLPAPTVEDTNEPKESSEESFINEDNDSGSDVIDNDGGVIDGDDGANITSGMLSYKTDSTPRELHVPLNALMGVEIAKYDVLESVDKVASENCNQAAQLISLDTIKLFDLVKSQHLVLKKMIRRKFGLHFYLCLYTSPEKLLEDWSTNLRLFWFSTFSHVQKLEWEPPP
ncbi:unnamed protein product [Cuscuta campestris]|uniref:Retrotransposon gag domain-containing protein n=1 Tax=Cuscuta campestris TaxID=132261 RepID=A0A484NN20_9ASTE|nr:unnamed protein product [Cuscuta campestris]